MNSSLDLADAAITIGFSLSYKLRRQITEYLKEHLVVYNLQTMPSQTRNLTDLGRIPFGSQMQNRFVVLNSREPDVLFLTKTFHLKCRARPMSGSAMKRTPRRMNSFTSKFRKHILPVQPVRICIIIIFHISKL